jgi:tRNA (guanine-N7-)-methyltransferase
LPIRYFPDVKKIDMKESKSPHLRTVRSFVLRGGRMTPSQKRAYDELWQTYGLDCADGMIDLEETFGRQAPTILEIGFGMGDSLVAMAKAAPEHDFIGIEVHKPGVGRLLNLSAEAGLKNIRVYCADALEVLNNCINNNKLNRIQLYFPDPWPKKKHHKRRILQPEFMALVRDKLQINGQFHAATDWQEYAEHMMVVLSGAPGFINQVSEGKFAPRPEYRPKTKFEKRGENLGHGVWDLIFERRS